MSEKYQNTSDLHKTSLTHSVIIILMITHPKFLAGLLAAGFLAGCVSRSLPASGPDGRPNVLFILTDDQRWDCIGLAPGSRFPTPNIDRIGREGIYFRNAFCTTSLCSPSR